MARIKTAKDESRKDVILTAAAESFRERGYKATSMRDLAEKVGIEAASLYNHIDSKSELLIDICFGITTLMNDFMTSVEENDQTSLQKVETILRFQIRQMVDNFNNNFVANREWHHLENPELTEFRQLRHEYRKRLNHIITKGIEEGEIKDTINVPATVWLLLHAVYGIESWHRSKVQVDASVLENNMITILISGLKK
ncbi:MAG: TetR/AcrR family transcriptional regulator [Pseudopedobacter saltans]|uniref:TetR/AcrR family transcriptional regulator n=1 Tax=Pseudopedobacter saltans TaxID=151895 RepID=A0A2W5EZU9_9SPHI|nr:MAG: TetR/AcrR family transcriptional regulator [Pseudopedobacter saltans]